MRNLVKKWWIYIILVIIILFIVILMFGDKGVGDIGISQEEFDKIENGMTMTEVCKIINKNNINKVASTQLERIEDITATLYKYRYEGEKSGYAIITYELSTTDLWLGSGAKVILKENYKIK